MRRCLYILVIIACTLPFHAQKPRDSEKLGMALEYFTAAKYHEALLLFEQLDKQYELNPRFHAYMGVCYFHEWQYEKACQYLESAIPQLNLFAPHERSVYYYTAGESHFQLQQYQEAKPYYEQALVLCYDSEKGDIYYRIGFCYLFEENWEQALNNFKEALASYKKFCNISERQARMAQTQNMIKGCESHLPQDTIMQTDSLSFPLPIDSLQQTPNSEIYDIL